MKKYVITLLTLLSSLFPLSNVLAQTALKTDREPMEVHPFETKKSFHQKTSGNTYPYRKIDGRNSQNTNSPKKFISLPGEALLTGSAVREIKLDPKRHLPIFIRSQHPVRRTSSGKIFDSQQEAREITFEHMKSLNKLFSLQDPAKELRIKAVSEDQLGHAHVKLIQQLEGIPIVGAELQVHYSPDGERIVNGHHFPTPHVDRLVPSISPEEALAIARQDLKSKGRIRRFFIEGIPSEIEHSKSTVELMIYPDPVEEGIFYLAYEIDLHASISSHWSYTVGAHYGNVLDAYSKACSFLHEDIDWENPTYHAAPLPFSPSQRQGSDLHGQNKSFFTYEVPGQQGSDFLMIDATKRMFKGLQSGKSFPGFGEETGSIFTLDFRNQAPGQDVTISYVFSNNDQWDPTAVSAHTNSSLAYDYFEQVHGRNSINNQAMDVVSFINVANEDGSSMDNAYWIDKYMFYGNGNRAFTMPLAAALDVGGHEMTHGVIASSSNLEYKNMSGALNESFADVFGIMIDRDDYKLAEDVANRDIFPSGAMRDMADPHNGGQPGDFARWQPRHMDEYVETQDDNGGVHINSGIPNHAAYRIIEEIGRDRTEQIYYRALTQYLTRSSNFLDARFAIVQSAKDLYGDQSQEASACARGFAAVGIGEPVPDNDTPTDPETKTPPLEVNPGSQFIMFTNVDPSCNCPLQQVDIEAGTIETVSLTHHIRPVSVSDDGSLAIMITDLRQVNLI
ncbi:MAG: M4 family metallopeptidase, partial [Bacteroidota bacterium]